MTDGLNDRFAHHQLDDSEDYERLAQIRERLRIMAHFIDIACPDGREKSLAITKLEEAMFWANASVARHYGVRELFPEEIG